MSDVAFSTRGLPDPDAHPEIYDDTPTKRLVAWLVDVAVTGALFVVTLPVTLVLIVGSLFTLTPVIWVTLSLAYRTATLSRGSATWGMRLMSIELRTHDGSRLDVGTTFAHTLLYLAAFAVFPLQVLSGAAMIGTPRRQGLGDLMLGTAAVNRTE